MDRQADALSRAERHRLRDIERALAQGDPDFAAEFDHIEPSDGQASRSRHRTTIGLIGLGVAGVGSLGAGLVLSLPIVGVAGFATIVFVLSRLDHDEQIIARLRRLVGMETANPQPPS